MKGWEVPSLDSPVLLWSRNVVSTCWTLTTIYHETITTPHSYTQAPQGCFPWPCKAEKSNEDTTE